MVNDLVYVRDPALAGFPRSTLVVKFAKFKRQNEFRKSSEFLGNQKLATLSANSISMLVIVKQTSRLYGIKAFAIAAPAQRHKEYER